MMKRTALMGPTGEVLLEPTAGIVPAAGVVLLAGEVPLPTWSLAWLSSGGA